MGAGVKLEEPREPDIKRVIFTAEQLQNRVAEMGEEISSVYGPSDNLVVLGVLKGSFMFMSDLIREIKVPLHVDFLVVSSYGKGKTSTDDVRLLYDSESSIKERAVLLVEDIIDSGATLRRLIPMLNARGPKSLDVCSLLCKGVEHTDVKPRWVGFDAPNEFLVGYGLDFAEDFRHLPYIASL